MVTRNASRSRSRPTSDGEALPDVHCRFAPFCRRMFHSKDDMNEHCRQLHAPGRLLYCEPCRTLLLFATAAEKDAHRKEHRRRCGHCSKIVYEYELASHRAACGVQPIESQEDLVGTDNVSAASASPEPDSEHEPSMAATASEDVARGRSQKRRRTEAMVGLAEKVKELRQIQPKMKDDTCVATAMDAAIAHLESGNAIVSASSEQADALRSQVEELEEKLRTRDEEIERLTKEKAEEASRAELARYCMEMKNASLAAQLKRQDAAIEQLEMEKKEAATAAMKQIDALEKTIDKREATAGSWDHRIKHLLAKLDEATALAAKHEADKIAVISAATKQVDALNKIVTEQDAALDAAGDHIQRLRAQLDEAMELTTRHEEERAKWSPLPQNS